MSGIVSHRDMTHIVRPPPPPLRIDLCFRCWKIVSFFQSVHRKKILDWVYMYMHNCTSYTCSFSSIFAHVYSEVVFCNWIKLWWNNKCNWNGGETHTCFNKWGTFLSFPSSFSPRVRDNTNSLCEQLYRWSWSYTCLKGKSGADLT